jgi:hypothetical protein
LRAMFISMTPLGRLDLPDDLGSPASQEQSTRTRESAAISSGPAHHVTCKAGISENPEPRGARGTHAIIGGCVTAPGAQNRGRVLRRS